MQIAVLKETAGKGTFCSLVMAVVVVKDILVFCCFAVNLEMSTVVSKSPPVRLRLTCSETVTVQTVRLQQQTYAVVPACSMLGTMLTRRLSSGVRTSAHMGSLPCAHPT